ncbi:hypothetical protein BCR35DRAFT_329115 [Leucosporidium creatinivorum]|uniref:CNNM transmembrane domain-containing protein n=1 Tax=Leucosporidium creatinivorum TaxID=106004 RepID=A0A1Y2FZZ2_9BASI|nr:hypothetical protein BCR35DRAFT_329115 [Leucosporidium creatinivorum]
MSSSIYRPARNPYAKLVVILTTAIPQIARVGAAPLVFDAMGHHQAPPGSEDFYFKLGFAAVLVILGGIFAGLTLGLMGLDMVNLQVLSTSSPEEQERKDAVKVMRLLERGRHWVLVVLLLSNVVVNESLPIFLDSVLGGGIGAVVVSTAAIVIFGEVIPQALCARYGLRIGAWAAPFVWALMLIEFPIAWPIAKLLDYLLGESHGTLYKKAELKTFVGLHRQIGGETLNEDEVTIISSVLELAEKSVSSIMTGLEDTYTLPADAVLDQDTVDQILALGHSRIPIHTPEDATDFMGMLIVKKLISYDPSQAQPLGSFPLSVLPETGPDSTCLDALNYFQQGRSHILLVSNTPGVAGGAIGVVTLEDVIEEMIGEEIVDETDLYVDLNNKIKVVRGPSKRVATGKALAPLIAGVIERRHARRQNTVDYGSGNVAAVAFDKVKLRNGKTPDRRKAVVGDTTPRPEQHRTFSAEPESITEGERKPLLERSSTSDV